MGRRFTGLALLGAIAFAHASAGAEETPYYAGKTVRIVVGFSAGGGFDQYARLLSRHLGKYLPGHPTIIVENMTGAGSLLAANHVYRAAKPDGLTVGHFNGGLLFSQALGQPGIDFEAGKFGFVGAVAREEVTFAFTKASGITSVEKWAAAKAPVKIGGLMPGAATDNVVRITKAATGLPLQLVSGYKGTADIRLACESGELGGAAWGWDSMRSAWRKSLDSGDVVVVLQGVPQPFDDLPKVPLVVQLAKTEEAKQLVELGIHQPSVFARPFVVPPGTPRDRLQLLRSALQQTLKDKEFLAEAEKAKLDLNPVSAEDLEKAVSSVLRMDPKTSARLKEILFK